MRRGLGVLSLLLFAVVAGCNGGVGSGTPPAPGTVNGQTQANSAANVSDDQAAGDAVDYYLQRMAYAAPSQQIQNRIVALRAFVARTEATPSPAPSGANSALPATDVPIPSAAPSFAPQRLNLPTFPSDDAPAKRLADQGAATFAHRVTDAKSPTQAPVDRIDITRGAVQWHIDLLTGRIEYAREHTAGVIENGAERAHEVAAAFVARHGGLPDDAVEVAPVYTMTQGDSSSAPKPTSITFVWRHSDPSVIGADVITATVTPVATNLSASPSPASGLEVTAYTRLWRQAGKTLAAGGTPPMSAARALAALTRSVALPAHEKVKAAVFGGLRASASAAPSTTMPAWAFEVGDVWYAVNALDGVVSSSTTLGVPSDAIAMVAAPKPKTAAAAAPTPTR